MTKLKVQVVDGGKFPVMQGSAGAAGIDLYARLVTWDSGHGVWIVPLGVRVHIPSGCFGDLRARSGIYRSGAWLANGCGVIDSDYRGEVTAVFYGDKPCEPGERCAQIVIQKYEPVVMELATSLEETERGEGGFGSTGVN